MRRLTLLVGLLLAILPPAPANARPEGRGAPPPLILISLDGFRPDYLDRGLTPALSALAADGVRGAMRPSFPTLTYPNHYTLVTGLRPDRHGVVGNVFEAPDVSPRPFSISDRAAVGDRRWWDEGEPLWVTAERQGLVTAPLYWPGSEAAVHGVRPDFWQAFDMKASSAARVDQVLAWLALPADRRPRFATLYFDIVDTAGHEGGPDSAQVDQAVAEVDAAIARLVAGLKARGLADSNIVIVADHGMAEVSPQQTVYFEDLAPPGALRLVSTGAVATLEATPGHEAQAEAALLGPHDHFTCWRRDRMPARLHYGHNGRIAPIVCLARTGWTLTTREGAAAHPVKGGAHGFDPMALEMQAVFIARGPAFRRGVVLPVFDNVDVYPLMAHVLGVKPRPNDGRLPEVAAALRQGGAGQGRVGDGRPGAARRLHRPL